MIIRCSMCARECELIKVGNCNLGISDFIIHPCKNCLNRKLKRVIKSLKSSREAIQIMVDTVQNTDVKNHFTAQLERLNLDIHIAIAEQKVDKL